MKKHRQLLSALKKLEIISVTQTDSDFNDPSSGQSFSIGSVPDNGQKRYVVACFGTFDFQANYITSMTIGGTPANEVYTLRNGNVRSGIYFAEVETGTSVSISYSTDGSISDYGIVVYSVIVKGTMTLDEYDFGSGSGSTDSFASWTGVTEDTDDDIRSDEILSTASGQNQSSPSVTGNSTTINFSVSAGELTLQIGVIQTDSGGNIAAVLASFIVN